MKKRKIKRRISHREELYKNIPLNHLILFSIYSVIESDEECTFERLANECFTLFPKVFSMSRYPQWPNTLKLDRPLRDLREQGLIIGSPKVSFSLTRFGEQIVRETAKVLKVGVKRKISYKVGRRANINWINFLKKSEAFQRFLKSKKKFSITEMELRNILRCTLETPFRIVKQNLQYSKNLAKEFKDQTLLEFLEVSSRIFNKKKYDG